MTIGVFPPIGAETSVPLAIEQGGTGATTAANARTNLGLGTLATQDASAVAITGGSATGLTTVNLTPTPGGSALVINDPGAGAINGLYTTISAGANRYNLYLAGSAPNYVAGKVGVGRPPQFHQLEVTIPTAGSAGISTWPQSDGLYPLYFCNAAGANVGSITTSATATAYNTSSDVRLKHAITALTGALDAIAALKPVRFRWNADDSQGHGFLAHELMQTIPEAVSGQPDEVNADGSAKPQQVDHSKLVPWLTAALQDAVAQVQALAARVAVLEGGTP